MHTLYQPTVDCQIEHFVVPKAPLLLVLSLCPSLSLRMRPSPLMLLFPSTVLLLTHLPSDLLSSLLSNLLSNPRGMTRHGILHGLRAP
jgi:hypothetical protein